MRQSFGRCLQGKHAFHKKLRRGEKRGKIFKYKTFLYVQNSPVEYIPFKVIPQLLITLHKSLNYCEKKHKHISIWLMQWSW